MIRVQSYRADRAIQEYDVSAFTGWNITSASLSGRVDVNNGWDNGVRTFDFLLYEGNGTADLSDYKIAANVVGSGQYHPPADQTFTFQFDVTTEVQSLLTGGATYIGLRAEGTSDPNFPNLLVAADCHLDIVAEEPSEVSFYCPGDGSGSACPCANSGTGAAGCANSANPGGASIGYLGSPSISGSFLLTAADAVPNRPGLFFEGTVQENGGAGTMLGDGLLCASGLIQRLEIVFTDGVGAATSSIDIPAESGVVVGETRHYQFWFRDPVVGPCARDYNLTNALTTTWKP
jgi:hypothetical protein